MALAEALKNNTSADHFHFDATSLVVDCLFIVLLSLAESKTFKSVRLMSDKLSDSLSAMSEILCVNTSIELLTLCGEKLDLMRIPCFVWVELFNKTKPSKRCLSPE